MEEEEKCLFEYGENGISWACENCSKKRSADLHPYTIKLLEVHSLQEGGYPFEKDDLTVDEWFDLSKVKRMYQSSLKLF